MTFLIVGGCFRNISAEPVQADVKLDKTALYSGLGDTTDLTGVLPSTPFVLSEQLNVVAAGHCFDIQIGDDCAKANSSWSVFQATYSDLLDKPVHVCTCQGSPFKPKQLADTFSQVSCVAADTIALTTKRCFATVSNFRSKPLLQAVVV